MQEGVVNAEEYIPAIRESIFREKQRFYSKYGSYAGRFQGILLSHEKKFKLFDFIDFCDLQLDLCLYAA